MNDLLFWIFCFWASESRDFNNVFAEKYMRESETTTNDAAIAENLFNLLWTGIGRDIKIFGFSPKQ